MLKVKDWSEFQHYKDRRPPWIKLHKTLLEKRKWFALSYASRALAMCLWLIASEHDDPSEGIIDDEIADIAFRVRMDEKEVLQCIKELIKQGFVESVNEENNDLLAPCYQDAIPETETEAESKTELYIGDELHNVDTAFENFWHGYPSGKPKGNKSKAKDIFKKIFEKMVKGDIKYEQFYGRVGDYNKFCTESGTFNQHATTWLNQNGWQTDWASQICRAPNKPRQGNRPSKTTGDIDQIIDAGEDAKASLRAMQEG